MNPFLNLDLAGLRACTIKTLREGKGTRPDVLLLEKDGARAVLKDHGAADKWFATLIGPLLAKREALALTSLADVDGVPKLLKRAGRRAVLMAYVDAHPVHRSDEIKDYAMFFEDLSNLIQEMHQAGVAHCDLRSPGNILVDTNGCVCLVDFVASCFQGREWNLPAAWVFGQACGVDRSAVMKWKARMAPALLSEVEKSGLGKESLLGRGVRNFGVWVRNLSRVLFTDGK